MAKDKKNTTAQGTTHVGGTTQPGATSTAAAKPPTAKKRSVHPSVGNTDKAVYPFAATPKDFDFKKFRPLKKKDFVTDEAFFLYKADEMTAKAADFTAKAAESKKLGSTKDKQAARRLLKMTEKMAELRKSLEADGVNVDELLAATPTKATEAPAATA